MKYLDNYIFLTIIYILSFSINFYLPGIQMDVANHFAFIPGIFDASAAKLHHFRLPDNFFDFLDDSYRYPILGGSFYNTTISAYIFAFFFEIFGYTYETLRLANLLRGFIIFVLIFYLLKKISIIGIYRVLFFLLLFSNSDIIFSLKGGTAPWNHLLFFLLGLIFFIKFIHYKKKLANKYYYVFLSGLFFGVSFISYFISIFYILPLVLALIIFNLKEKKDFIYLVSGIFIGTLPLIYSYISVYLISPTLLHDLRPPFVLANNNSILSIKNLFNSLSLLQQGGYHITKSIAGYYHDNNKIFMTLIFIIVQILMLNCLIVRKCNSNERIFFFLTYVIFILFFFGAFILKSLNFHHALTLQIVFYFQIILILKVYTKKLFIYCFIIIIVGFNFKSLSLAHHQLEYNGGHSYFNEKYSTVPLEISKQNNDVIVFTSWGFHLQFLFLTKGKKKYYFTSKLNKIDEILKNNLDIILIGKKNKQITEYLKNNKDVNFQIEIIKSRANMELFEVIKLKKI